MPPILPLANDTPSAFIVIVVEPVAASTFIPVHRERVGVVRVGRERECVVGVLHAPIITEPQAISSLGSDIFQISIESSIVRQIGRSKFVHKVDTCSWKADFGTECQIFFRKEDILFVRSEHLLKQPESNCHLTEPFHL